MRRAKSKPVQVAGSVKAGGVDQLLLPKWSAHSLHSRPCPIKIDNDRLRQNRSPS